MPRPSPIPSNEPYSTYGNKKKKDKDNSTPSYSDSYDTNSGVSEGAPKPQIQHGSYKPSQQNTNQSTGKKQSVNQSNNMGDYVPQPQTYAPGYKRMQEDNYGYSDYSKKSSGKANSSQSGKGGFSLWDKNTAVTTYVTKDRVQSDNGKKHTQPQDYNVYDMYSGTTKREYSPSKADSGYGYSDYLKNIVNSRTVPNSSDWGTPKTIKDGAGIKAQYTPTTNANYGPNRETAHTVEVSRPNTEKEFLVNYLQKMAAGSTGKSKETAQTTFLDHRGQNPVEQLVEKNSFKGISDEAVVTKDNVYYQPPEKVEKELNNTGNLVNSEISALKRQREDLLFDLQYGRIKADDERLQKVNYDIQYLQHIEKKIELGLKFSYQFAQKELEGLSQASIDDILNSKEEYGDNLPYLSLFGNAARTTNKGFDNYQNSIGVVENIGVEYHDYNDTFTIFDKNNPQNKFKFSTEQKLNPKGYYEYIIKADKDAAKTAENVQYDLLKAIDSKPVSGATIEKLAEMAKENGKSSCKLLDVVGYTLDFADFWIVMESDREFNGGEAGVDTYKAFGEFSGSVIGDRLGGIAGAKAGAAIGTAAFGPIGTVIGGVLGAAAGAYLLSSAMEEIGGYLGEYVYEYEPADKYQQYYIRAK